MKRILYVDDNPAKISEFKTHFSDYEVLSFDNPLEAAEKVGGFAYDTLVLDIIMPFMDGFSLYDKLIHMDNYIGQPIFFLSETKDEELMLKALDLGAEELLTGDMPWLVKRKRIENKLKMEENDGLSNFGIHFNLLDSVVSKGGVKVELTKTEMILLRSLCEESEITMENLVSRVWGREKTMARNNLSTHLTNLNKKIKIFGQKAKVRNGMVTLFQA